APRQHVTSAAASTMRQGWRPGAAVAAGAASPRRRGFTPPAVASADPRQSGARKLLSCMTRSHTAAAPMRLDHPGSQRTPGFPLELDWVTDVRVNRSAVERRSATFGTRRTVKKEWQAAWLLRALTFMDLTTLAGDDTAGYV